MRMRVLVAVVLSLALVGLPTVAASADQIVNRGLWDADHSATATDCGVFPRDANGFCVADDPREPVVLGVKFTSSKFVKITGVRVYRVDDGAVQGSLWTQSGRLLRTGTFAASSGPGWQDLTFDRPIWVWPGGKFVASYVSPNAKYAFEYNSFANGPVTVGPITALESVEGDGNGLYCYDDGSCFPTETFRDSNYWVSPLWEEHVSDESDDDESDDDESDDDD